MGIIAVLTVAVALAALFIGLRYVEAYKRRKDLERRGRIKPARQEDQDKVL
jgi:hypothetical protein